jgi:hypothetical protein
MKEDLGEIVVICTNNQLPSPLDVNLSLCYDMICLHTKTDIQQAPLLIVRIVIVFSGVLLLEGRGYFVTSRCV